MYSGRTNNLMKKRSRNKSTRLGLNCTFSKLWRWFSAAAAVRRVGLILLLILLPGQLLLECGRARLPPAGPPPEGAGAALPGVLVTVGSHGARVPPALPDGVLRRAVRGQGVPPTAPASVIILVTGTQEGAGASSAGLRLAWTRRRPRSLVETLVIGSGLSSDLMS